MTNEEAPAVDMVDASLSFPQATGKSLFVLDHLNLKVRKGEIVSLVGPSGCGKTTILKLIVGLLEPTKGTVMVAGRAATLRKGHSGYVPQGYSLFPWLTVRRNIETGMRYMADSEEVIRQRVSQLLAVTKLEEFANAFPLSLSGGMKQRVAIARALAVRPDVLLMDEPFSALDFQARSEIQDYFLKLIQVNPCAVIIVTHDVREAVLLSDRVLVLSQCPASIQADIAIPCARPRSRHIEILGDIAAIEEQIATIAVGGFIQN